MIHATRKPARGDALVRRHIAQWRRITARLQVLVNTGAAGPLLADEAHTLQRQCERLAAELAHLAASARQRRPGQALPPLATRAGQPALVP